MSVPETLGSTAGGRARLGCGSRGAGPAGSLAALALAGWGVPTLLVERSTFPRYKVCGCCIDGRTRAVLERAGVADVLARSGAVPLTSVRMGADKRSARLSLAGGFALSRERFDAALVGRAVRAGAHFLPGTRASLGGARTMRGSSAASYCIRAQKGWRCGRGWYWLRTGSAGPCWRGPG